MELDYIKLREIKPVLSRYIRETQTLMKLSVVPDNKTVHDVRVLMKKSRAVLKLVGNQMETDFFKMDLHDLREIGRILSSWRETAVNKKILIDLKKDNPLIFSSLQEDKIINALLAKNDTVPELNDEMEKSLKEIDELLNKTSYRIRFQSMDKLDPQLLVKELATTYSSVTDMYLLCRNNCKSVNVHDLRKNVKLFLYQLYFFRTLNPGTVKNLEKKLNNMARNLGKFNDLAQLISILGYKYSEGANDPAMDELAIKIRDKQDKYLAQVWPVAYKIFCPGQNLINALGFRVLLI
jgi:CHAD domain-containing protein